MENQCFMEMLSSSNTPAKSVPSYMIVWKWCKPFIISTATVSALFTLCHIEMKDMFYSKNISSSFIFFGLRKKPHIPYEHLNIICIVPVFLSAFLCVNSTRTIAN